MQIPRDIHLNANDVMEGEQRRAKTGFNATTDILIIDKMLTQLYNRSYFTRLSEWMNALTHCFAGVLELCTIEVYLAFKTGTSTQNDVTRRLFSKSSEKFGTCTVRFFTRNKQTKYLERQRCNEGANESPREQREL